MNIFFWSSAEQGESEMNFQVLEWPIKAVVTNE